MHEEGPLRRAFLVLVRLHPTTPPSDFADARFDI